MARQNESVLRQKARINWIQNGDYNSKFYHAYVNARRIFNLIKGLEHEGRWVKESIEVKDITRNFFSSKFSSSKEILGNIGLENIPFKCLSNDQISSLVQDFEEIEIKEAIWGCEGSKAPKSDNFNFKFFKEFWPLLKNDILLFMKKFHMHGCFPRGANAPFIALILKVNEPHGLGEYRHISLVGFSLQNNHKTPSKKNQSGLA